tara:strand:+ start:487 stop:1971 length:1485 start_codon:yes stop_codon:yes gene_type:complete
MEEQQRRARTLITCSNTLVVRFCLYGFLKNLKFFEPFIVTLLIKWGLSLTAVGLLISVEKITTYIFELPSGYLSDRYGARTTLCSCFILYIISFLCYYFGQVHFTLLIFASFFYGLADAMRSGAHKSMVFLWLEKHDLLTLKSYLNGKTRSFSLLGSAVAAIAGIFFSLYLDADRTIFLCSIPAYILDLFIVASYPSYMNTTTATGSIDTSLERKKAKDKKKNGKSGGFYADMKALTTVMQTPGPRRVVLTTAATGVFHRVFKDFIQPVVIESSNVFPSTTLTTTGVASIYNTTTTLPPNNSNYNIETMQTIVLGTAYCFFYLFSSPASQNAYRCQKICGWREKNVMDVLLDSYSFALLTIGISLYVMAPIVVPFIYVCLYVVYNISKPLSASAVSDVAGKRLRATVFSADAALQTLLTACLAPLAGFMADNISLASMFLTFAGGLVFLNRIFIAEVSLVEVCCRHGSSNNDSTKNEYGGETNVVAGKTLAMVG